MTDTEFQKIIKALQSGNEKPLDQIFLDHYQYSIAYLIREFGSGTFQCSDDDAKDVFMDAILKLRIELIKGKVENRNLRGYLITICRNIWLKKKTREKPSVSLDVEKVEYYLGQQADVYNDEFDPLIKKELAADLDQNNKNKADAFAKAWPKLGAKCQELLQAFYIDGLKLKDLQARFGYGSYDSIKSMRRKCFNQLKKWKDQFL